MRPSHCNLPLLQDIGAVADKLGEVDVLLREQNRQALLLQLDDRLRHLLDDHGRHALRRLVQQRPAAGCPSRCARRSASAARRHSYCAPRRSGMRPRLGKIANSFSGVHDGAGRPSGKRRGGWRPMSRFSSTVRSEKMRRSSGTKPSPRRAISNGWQPRYVLAAEADACRCAGRSAPSAP